MNIAPDPKAWKPWRSAVRARIKKDPALRREYRRASKLRVVTGSSLSSIRAIIPLILGVLAWHDIASATLLGWLTLWTLLVTTVRCQQVAHACHSPDGLWLFYGWPLSDDDVFAHQRRLVLRSSVWLGLDWLAFGGVIALRTGDTALLVATPLLALGQWAATLGIALFLGRIIPRFPFGWVLNALGILLFVDVHLSSGGASPHLFFEHLRQGVLTATPAGWLLQSWQLFAAGNAFGWIALVLLAGSAIASVVFFARQIRTAFNPERIFDYHSPADNDSLRPTVDESPLPTIPVTPENVRAALESPAGLAFTSRGPVEHSLAWFLDLRQRTLVDFMLPGGMAWHRRWLISAGLITLALICRETFAGLELIPALLAIAFALPVLGGRWAGFDSAQIFQAQIAVHAYAPVGFGEISRCLLKINALHCLLAFPLVVAAMGFGLAPDDAGTAWALDFGLRVTALVFAIQPLILLGKFSANSNDSSGGKLFAGALILAVVVGFLGGMVLIIFTLISTSFTTALACIGGLMAITHAMLALYGHAWGRGRFDQMARIRE